VPLRVAHDDPSAARTRSFKVEQKGARRGFGYRNASSGSLDTAARRLSRPSSRGRYGRKAVAPNVLELMDETLLEGQHEVKVAESLAEQG